MSQATRIKTLCLSLMLGLVSPSLFAERADRTKPMTVEADHFVHDEARRISKFQGKVILSKGSLQIRADELEVIEDQEGYQSATALGKPVEFTQKREAVNEMIDGQA